jgi:hypothetical protein
MSAAEDLEAIRQMLVPLAGGDTRPFVQGLADDIVWHLTGVFPWAGTYRGKRILREQLFGQAMARLKQPYRLALKHLSSDGEFVTVVLQGVENETLEGLPYPQQYCWICRLQDGKLKEVTEFADTYLVMRTLGPPARPADAARAM